MNNTARTIGVSERVLYSIILGLTMKLVALGWITGDMAPYYATGIAAGIMGDKVVERPGARQTGAGADCALLAVIMVGGLDRLIRRQFRRVQAAVLSAKTFCLEQDVFQKSPSVKAGAMFSCASK